MGAQVVDRILVHNPQLDSGARCHCCCVVLRFDVSHHGQAEVEVQLKEVKAEIKGVVSQIKEKEGLALEAFERWENRAVCVLQQVIGRTAGKRKGTVKKRRSTVG
jgi:hypothetical protein